MFVGRDYLSLVRESLIVIIVYIVGCGRLLVA